MITYSREQLVNFNLGNAVAHQDNIENINLTKPFSSNQHAPASSQTRKVEKELVAPCLSIDTKTPAPRALTAIYLNARSLSKHALDLWSLLDTEKPDICLVTETWLTTHSSSDVAIAFPPEYHINRLDRELKKGGGLVIASKVPVTIKILESNMSASLEILTFSATHPLTQSWKGALIYRPPGPRSLFANLLLENIAAHVIATENFILVGDFNHHMNDSIDPDSLKLLETMNSLGLTQKIVGPTHVAGHTLDLIFTNLTKLAVEPPLPILWSDHYILKFSIPLMISGKKNVQKKRSVRPWHKLTSEAFMAHLHLPQINMNDPIEVAVNALEVSIATSLDKLIPSTWVKQRNIASPWFTEELKIDKQTCRAA